MTGQRRAQIVLVNGELRDLALPAISAADRGFTLGDGVFETIRVVGGRPFRLADHLARLHASASTIDLAIPESDERLAELIDSALGANGLADAVIRLTLTRGAASRRGLLPSGDEPTLAIQATAYPPPEPDFAAEGIRGLAVITSAVRRNEHSPTSRIKSCSYLDNVLARLEAQRAGADDAIMLNTAGYLACCTTSNLHLVVAGRITTPALDCGALAGVTRGVVRELAESAGVGWEGVWLRPEAVLSVDEAFLTNCALGVVPIVRVDGADVGSGAPGPLTLWLRRRHAEALVASAG